MDNLLHYAIGGFIACAIIFGYFTIKKGGAWAITTLKGWWNSGKADLEGLKSDIASLKADVAALKTKVGV